jgi:hypothetical protein
MILASRIFWVTTQEAAIQEAGRAVALTAILTDKEKEAAQLLSESPPMVRNQNSIRFLIALLEAISGTRNGGSTAAATALAPDPSDGSSLIWALGLEKMGQTEKACSIMPDLRERFVNELTIDLALECADRRLDTNALARYLALTEQEGLEVRVTNYYRGEMERFAGRPKTAATWYYSFLGEALKPDDSRVKSARAFLNSPSKFGKIHPFDVPAGYGVVVLIRSGEWAGSANGRLVTSQSGAKIYGRLGPGEFLVIPLRPGTRILRLLGSLAVGLHKEVAADVKAGEISVFDVQTDATSIAMLSGLQKWASCADNMRSPMMSGGQLVTVVGVCLGTAVVEWAGEKYKERHDDFLTGPALDAKPVLGESWRQTIQSMRPAEPWGGA